MVINSWDMSMWIMYGIWTRRSLTSYIFTFFGCTMSWKSTIITRSCIVHNERQVYSRHRRSQRSILLKGLVDELGCVHDMVEVFCDNQNSIYLPKNQMFHDRKKHINIKFYFIQDVVSWGIILVEKIHMDDNLTNIVTKPVTGIEFKYSLDLISVTSTST